MKEMQCVDHAVTASACLYIHSCRSGGSSPRPLSFSRPPAAPPPLLPLPTAVAVPPLLLPAGARLLLLLRIRPRETTTQTAVWTSAGTAEAPALLRAGSASRWILSAAI